MASGRAILFDFNGVIIDDEPQHCDALIITLAEHGVPLDRETYYRDYLGFDDRECFRFGLAGAGRPADAGTITAAIEQKATHYERSVRRAMTLIPGAADFIRAAAAAGYRLGIVSGALRREIDLMLGVAGLRAQFDVVVAAEDVPACKPDPAGYLRALEALGVASARCVVIEDSRPGLDAARAAGLRCAMLTTSHPADELADADAVWPDLSGRAPDQLPWADA